MSGTAADFFFWNDWRGDPLLRMCSLAARGLWMEMLCIAAESTRKGEVLLNGQAPSVEELAQAVGTSVEEVHRLLDELMRWGVPTRNRNGIYCSRRMIRDAKKRRASAKGGKKGGAVSRDNKRGIFSTPDTTPHPARDAAPHPMDIPVPVPVPIPVSKKDIEIDKSISRSKPARVSDETLAGFDRFWNLCPRKVSRGRARKAYVTACAKTSPVTIEEGMRRYAASRVGEDETFTAHPASWLNAERWLDAPAVTNGAAPALSAAMQAIKANEDVEREQLKKLGVI